ncbi:hypothetical protein TNCV_1028081 [Trichonephila clavipes]|nr:hypothetical protein TNCV_1028081 [Trichonephila clavipes]
MNQIRKTTPRLDCPHVLSEEFIEVDDAKVCTAPIMANKGLLDFLQSLKISLMHITTIEVMNNTVPVSISSERRNTIKSM